VAASLLLGACAGGMGGGGGSSSSSATHALVGAPAPAFELRELAGGGDQSLEAHAGKVVIVDFWATWCEPCKQSFPVYQKLVTHMGGDLVVVASAKTTTPKASRRSFLRRAPSSRWCGTTARRCQSL